MMTRHSVSQQMVFLAKHGKQRSQIQIQNKCLFQQGKIHYGKGVQNNQLAANGYLVFSGYGNLSGAQGWLLLLEK